MLHKSEYMVLFYHKHKDIAKLRYESLVFHFIANIIIIILLLVVFTKSVDSNFRAC